jgi:replicative DNA helicase
MLSVEEWENLERGSAALRDSPIYIFDTPGISIDKLEEQVHMFCKQNKAKAVFIDYLQLIQSKGNTNWTRNDEVTDVVCRLKSLAMTLNVPFIILSQTNRPEHKEVTDSIYTPKLSDLRDSGTIEDVSDMVMFIHRPEYYQVYQDEYGNDLRGITELYIEKNLTGHRHRIRLKSNYDIASFESVQTQNLSFDTGHVSPFGIF